MSASVNDYITRLEQQLRQRGIHDPRFLAEAREHLLDAIEDGRRHGLATEQAESKALEQFGSPEIVAAHVLEERGHVKTGISGAFAAVWRHKWWVLVPTISAAVITGLTSSYVPLRYRSATTILVVPHRVPENYVGSSVTTRSEDRLRTINQQVRNRTKLERIIEDFNLYPERRKTDHMQDIVDDMSKSIDVENILDDVFRIAFTSDNPRTAQQVAERLATYLIDESLKDRATLAEGANEFLETQVAEAGRQLRETERKIAEYRKLHEGEFPDQTKANLEGLNNANMQLITLGLSLDRSHKQESQAQLRISELTSAVEAAAALPPPPAADPASKAAQLEAARAEFKELAAKYGRGNPQYDKAAARVTELEREIQEERSSPILIRLKKELDDARLDLEGIRREIASLVSQQARLKGQMEEYQRRIEAVPVRNTELTALTRDYNTRRSQYDSLYTKHLDSQVAANLERRQIGEQFRILDAARLPEQPVGPSRLRAVLMGALVGFATGLVLVVVRRSSNTNTRPPALAQA